MCLFFETRTPEVRPASVSIDFIWRVDSWVLITLPVWLNRRRNRAKSGGMGTTSSRLDLWPDIDQAIAGNSRLRSTRTGPESKESFRASEIRRPPSQSDLHRTDSTGQCCGAVVRSAERNLQNSTSVTARPREPVPVGMMACGTRLIRPSLCAQDRVVFKVRRFVRTDSVERCLSARKAAPNREKTEPFISSRHRGFPISFSNLFRA